MLGPCASDRSKCSRSITKTFVTIVVPTPERSNVQLKTHHSKLKSPRVDNCDGRELTLRDTTVLRANLAASASAGLTDPTRCKGRIPASSGACNSRQPPGRSFHHPLPL